MHVPVFKKILSYFHPVWIDGVKKNDGSPELELLLYQGRWQVATSDAVYSDGDKYTPIITAYKALDKKLVSVKSVLVLGSALGSAVEIMSKKGYSPDFTLIDNDAQILTWAKELMPEYSGNLRMIQADAMFYLDTDNNKYDLLIVDVFIGRSVPGFITTKSFMQNCRQHISEGGSFVLNYIISGDKEWESVHQIINAVFPQNRVIKNGINRVVVATV